MALVGAAAAILAVPLPWANLRVGSPSSIDFPVSFLLSGKFGATGGLSIGVLVLILAGVGALLFSFPKLSFLRRLCGGTIALVAVVFAAQLIQTLTRAQQMSPTSIAVGVFLALVGGVVMAAG